MQKVSHYCLHSGTSQPRCLTHILHVSSLQVLIFPTASPAWWPHGFQNVEGYSVVYVIAHSTAALYTKIPVEMSSTCSNKGNMVTLYLKKVRYKERAFTIAMTLT